MLFAGRGPKFQHETTPYNTSKLLTELLVISEFGWGLKRPLGKINQSGVAFDLSFNQLLFDSDLLGAMLGQIGLVSTDFRWNFTKVGLCPANIAQFRPNSVRPTPAGVSQIQVLVDQLKAMLDQHWSVFTIFVQRPSDFDQAWSGFDQTWADFVGTRASFDHVCTRLAKCCLVFDQTWGCFVQTWARFEHLLVTTKDWVVFDTFRACFVKLCKLVCFARRCTLTVL